jgi:hypothetical protein
MFNRARSMFAAAIGIAALACGAAFGMPHHRTPTVATETKKQRRGLFNGAVVPPSSSLRGISALRISVAQGKRNAVKCRNQRRHKRHTRG